MQPTVGPFTCTAIIVLHVTAIGVHAFDLKVPELARGHGRIPDTNDWHGCLACYLERKSDLGLDDHQQTGRLMRVQSTLTMYADMCVDSSLRK